MTLDKEKAAAALIFELARLAVKYLTDQDAAFSEKQDSAKALVADQRVLILTVFQRIEQSAAERERLVAQDRIKTLEEALREIEALETAPYDFPSDWDEQRAACPECLRYKDHPIQLGICDEHRRPLWARDRHRADEEKALGYRAKDIAQRALKAEEPR